MVKLEFNIYSAKCVMSHSYTFTFSEKLLVHQNNIPSLR